jgi:ubiquinone/menaquinone biosynthesis C-methylase UbiE
MVESDAFKAFEHAGWSNDSTAISYHRCLSDVTRGCIPELFRATGLKAGDKVLDVACGAGYVAAAARDRGANAIASIFPRLRFGWQSKLTRTTDLSRAMLRLSLLRTASSMWC